MTTVIRDSLKPYAVVADAAQNMWDVFAQTNSGNVTYAFVQPPSTRYATDTQALRASMTISNGDAVLAQKAGSTNDGTCYAFFAFINNNTFTATGTSLMFQVLDGATAQCTVEFTTLGVINIRTGGKTGTIAATFAGAFSQQQWNGWNIQIVIGAGTSGSVIIRKNGAGTNTFSATGIATQATANAFAQTYSWFLPNANGSTLPASYTFQDLWAYSGTGSFPNSFLPNDVRTFWQAPNGASQTQFTPSAIPTIGPSTITGTLSVAANTQSCGIAITPTYNGTLSTVALTFNAAATGSVAVALYDASGAGGSPGILLATSNTVTNPVINSNTFTFSSPPALSNLSQYYLVVLSSVAIVLKSSGSNVSGFTVARTFGSGFVSPAAMNAATQTQMAYALTYTSANFTAVSELIEDGATTTISSSTAGQEDRYAVAPLPVTPTQIYGVQLRAFGQKSDSGARSGANTITSGATNVAGTAAALSTSFENITFQQDTDPNTSAAWTPSGLNAALIGVKVAA